MQRFSALKICFFASAIKYRVKLNHIANMTGRGYLNIGLLFVMFEKVVLGGNVSDFYSINALF